MMPLTSFRLDLFVINTAYKESLNQTDAKRDLKGKPVLIQVW